MDDLDQSRSLELKRLLSEYFDRRRDRSLASAQQQLEELEELATCKVGQRSRDLRGPLAPFRLLTGGTFSFVCS